MSARANKRKNLGFLIVFVVLTVLCWCPIGYGRYGEVDLIMGMPSWAFVLLLIGALLFILEWVYLFKTDLALYEKDVAEIVDVLKKIDMEETRS
ncbi:MAG: DUF997 domain-containing protein [Desulfotignum sp.]|nr:DUF997 domain-containing protein [Desulfotignum sp.]